jgi:ceramide glucosyltransferase
MLTLALAWLGWMFAALAVAGTIYTAMSAVLVSRFFTPRRRSPAGAPEPSPFEETVSLLKPLHGVEPGLRQNLAAHFLQTFNNPLEIVSGVQRADDPAADVARAVMAEHPAISSVVAVGDHPEVPNRKVANLIQMLAHATGETLVVTDSDIKPPPDHLRRVLAALATPGVGVVTCPYFGVGETGFWSDVSALGLRYQFLPNVVTGVSLGMATPCMGSTIALRRETLVRIGGFEAFGATLADDYAMGAAVRALGLRSHVAPVLVAHSCSERSLGEVFRHELRWARTVKGVNFAGHLGSVVTHPVPLALAALLLTGYSPLAVAVLASAIVARFLLSFAIDRAVGYGGRLLWLLPVRDMLSFGVFASSFLGHAVEWRGEKFHVSANGDLSPV